MKRILLSSLIAIICGTGARAADDSAVPIARIELDSPQSYVVTGLTLGIRATAYNAVDAVLAGRSLRWSVSDPNLASVDDSGNLRGLRPGLVEVTAGDPGGAPVTGSVKIYVYPARVVVTLSPANIETGDTANASTQAFDANGNLITGLSVTYSTGDSAIALASGSTITGKAEGRTPVLANLDMGPDGDAYSASTVITVAPRSDYRVKRLLSTSTQSSNLTLGVPFRASAAGNYVASISSVSNGGQALVLARAGQKPRILDSAGAIVDGSDNKVIASFWNVAVNANGDVAALAYLPAEWCEQVLLVYRASANWKPVIALSTTNCNVEIQPRSIDGRGAVAYRAGNDYLRWNPDGSVTRLFGTGGTIAGLRPLNYLNGWGYTPFGTLVFLWVDTANTTTAMAWDGASRYTKIAAVGGVVDSRTIQYLHLPVEINAGDFVTWVGTNTWSAIARFKGTSAATVLASSGSDQLGWIQSYFDGMGEDVYFHADMDGKTNLFRLSGGTNRTVVSVFQLWREIGPVWVSAPDTVISFSPASSSGPLTVRSWKGAAAAAGALVMGPGVAVDGSAYLGLTQNAFARSASTASPILRTAGDFIMRWTGSGLAAILKPGDSLPGNRSLSYIHSFAANRKGDFVISAQTQQDRSGLWAYRNGALQLLAETDQPIGPGTTLTYQYAFCCDRPGSYAAINSKGQVAATFGASNGGYIYLFDAAAAAPPKLVAQLSTSAPGGGTYTCCGPVQIDEAGRVSFINNVNPRGATLFVWDGSSAAARRILATGDTDPLGRNVQWIYNAFPSGDRLFFNASIAGFGTHILSADLSGKVDIAVQPNTATSAGLILNYLFGPEFAAGGSGDLVFPAMTPAGGSIVTRRASDTGGGSADKVAATAARRTVEGDWLLTPFPGAATDTGDIFFPAYYWSEGQVRFGLYQATPR